MEILVLFLRKHCETESGPGNHHGCAVPLQLRADVQTSATITVGSDLGLFQQKGLARRLESAFLAASEVFFMITGDAFTAELARPSVLEHRWMSGRLIE